MWYVKKRLKLACEPSWLGSQQVTPCVYAWVAIHIDPYTLDSKGRGTCYGPGQGLAFCTWALGSISGSGAHGPSEDARQFLKRRLSRPGASRDIGTRMPSYCCAASSKDPLDIFTCKLARFEWLVFAIQHMNGCSTTSGGVPSKYMKSLFRFTLWGEEKTFRACSGQQHPLSPHRITRHVPTRLKLYSIRDFEALRGTSRNFSFFWIFRASCGQKRHQSTSDQVCIALGLFFF